MTILSDNNCKGPSRQGHITKSTKAKRQCHRTCGKLLENSSVLSERLKVSNDGAGVTDDVSKLFQASAAAAGKARHAPIVGRRGDGISSLSVASDLKCRRDSMSATPVNLRARYDGASPCCYSSGPAGLHACMCERNGDRTDEWCRLSVSPSCRVWQTAREDAASAAHTVH